MVMSKKEIVLAAKHLIEGGWTQGCEARDDSGNPVDFDSPEASCFCITGAMQAASFFVGSQSIRRQIYQKIVEKKELQESGLAAESAAYLVAKWNDDQWRTKEEIISLLNELAKEM